MSYLVKKPNTARDAMRYFHAVALDYVADLKERFPNHDISCTPFELSADNPLNIKARVWDRTLHIEFEIFATPQQDSGLRTDILGNGRLMLLHHFEFRHYVLAHGKEEWLYLGNKQRGTLDADFLLERMPLLLDQLPY